MPTARRAGPGFGFRATFGSHRRRAVRGGRWRGWWRPWAEADAHGRWTRLKLCPADDCLVPFYDRSKNRSRRWCDVAVCGNREKTRTYRSRHT